MSQPLIGQGEFALVKEHLTTAIQKPPIGWNPVGDHEILVSLTDTAAIQRDENDLTAYASRAYEVSLSLGHLLYRAVSLRALGILAWLQHDASRAEAHLRDSLILFQQLETHWQIGRTLYDLGEISVSLEKTEEAKKYFALSITEFDLLRAQPMAEQARGWFMRLETKAERAQ